MFVSTFLSQKLPKHDSPDYLSELAKHLSCRAKTSLLLNRCFLAYGRRQKKQKRKDEGRENEVLNSISIEIFVATNETTTKTNKTQRSDSLPITDHRLPIEDFVAFSEIGEGDPVSLKLLGPDTPTEGSFTNLVD